MDIIKDLTKTNFTKGNNRKISYIVMHYVGAVSSAKNNATYFKSTYRGASAHYFVDDNEIVQVVEDKDVSWHSGADKYYSDARNSNSIGIEMCCYKNNGKLDISEKTVSRAIELVKELMKKYNIPVSNVIRHYDVSHKVCPAPFINDVSRWNDFKARLGQVESKKEELKSEKVIKTVKVTADIGLNIRKKPTTSSSILGAYAFGTQKEIYEIKDNWGRTKDGWICLTYTDYKIIEEKSNIYKKGTYIVDCSVLTVRTSPEIKEKNWLRFNQLSKNAQEQIAKLNKSKPNGLVRGVICDVSEVKNNWGKIPSGWICLDYCKKK